MKSKFISFILILVLMFNILIPKRVNASVVVGTEVAIEVGTVLYYIIQGVITGIEVKTIVETISTGSETYQVYKKTDGSSNTMYKFVNSTKTRIKPAVAQALVDGLTDKQLVEMANNVTINEDGMLDTGGISTATKKAVNGIMINISGSVPMYENYYTELVQRRKLLSTKQLDNVREIINQFSYDKLNESDYKYPYFAIVPRIDSSGSLIYKIFFSTTPLVAYTRDNISFDIVPLNSALTTFGNGEKQTVTRPYTNTGTYSYTFGFEQLRVYTFFQEPFVFPKNIFLENDILAIGHGIIPIDQNTLNSFYMVDDLDYNAYKTIADKVYEIPYSLANVNDTYTYIDKEKEEIVIKDGPLPVTGDLDYVISQLENYEETDKENHLTWDNTESAKNKLITDVIDNSYVDIPIDTPVDLTGVNKRLDEVIEKLGGIIGSIGDINALTDEQLKEILKDLDLTNTDGLTIEQVREYAEERELEQEKELENELDLEKYKVDNGIINKFPFCIPFDLIKVIKKMDSTSTAPKFEFPFKFARLGINETIVLDLSQFENVAVVVRWFVLISYLLLLIYATRSLIKG